MNDYFHVSAHKQEHMRHEAQRMFYFDFSQVPATDAVTKADFRLHKVPVDSNTTFIITVHQLTKDSMNRYVLNLLRNEIQ